MLVLPFLYVHVVISHLPINNVQASSPVTQSALEPGPVTITQPLVSPPHPVGPAPIHPLPVAITPPQPTAAPITPPAAGQQSLGGIAVQPTPVTPSNSEDVLRDPDEVIRKYPKLNSVANAGRLAVRLATESYFGDSILRNLWPERTRCITKGKSDGP